MAQQTTTLQYNFDEGDQELRVLHPHLLTQIRNNCRNYNTSQPSCARKAEYSRNGYRLFTNPQNPTPFKIPGTDEDLLAARLVGHGYQIVVVQQKKNSTHAPFCGGRPVLFFSPKNQYTDRAGTPKRKWWYVWDLVRAYDAYDRTCLHVEKVKAQHNNAHRRSGSLLATTTSLSTTTPNTTKTSAMKRRRRKSPTTSSDDESEIEHDEGNRDTIDQAAEESEDNEIDDDNDDDQPPVKRPMLSRQTSKVPTSFTGDDTSPTFPYRPSPTARKPRSSSQESLPTPLQPQAIASSIKNYFQPLSLAVAPHDTNNMSENASQTELLPTTNTATAVEDIATATQVVGSPSMFIFQGATGHRNSFRINVDSVGNVRRFFDLALCQGIATRSTSILEVNIGTDSMHISREWNFTFDKMMEKINALDSEARDIFVSAFE